jgi:hypothetical protein
MQNGPFETFPWRHLPINFFTAVNQQRQFNLEQKLFSVRNYQIRLQSGFLEISISSIIFANS